MSTLTKILIVLLTLSSIFLCGITVTYVGTATNYKEKFDSQKSTIDSLRTDNADKVEQLNTLQKDKETTINTLKNKIDEHQRELDSLNTELTKKQIDLDNARDRLENTSAILSDNAETVKMNTKLREEADQKVIDLQAQQTNNLKKIQDLTDEIVILNATNNQLETDNKRLIEEKTKLQNDMDRYLQLAGVKIIPPAPVTSTTGPVQIAPAVRDIDLEGVIMEVKPQDSLASISIGSAHGVRDKMKFHVIRNNSFICDVVVTKVDADQSSGYLDLVTDKMPKAGDKVKTNF